MMFYLRDLARPEILYSLHLNVLFAVHQPDKGYVNYSTNLADGIGIQADRFIYVLIYLIVFQARFSCP